VGNFLLPLSKFVYHHFTVYSDSGYFVYIVSPYGNHTSGAISIFEVNLISKLTLKNEKYVP